MGNLQAQRNPPLKVLISAYACEPGRGSEPGVGWNWVRHLSRFCDVWVITSMDHREPIEKFLAKLPLANLHWAYLDLPYWAFFWRKKQGRRGVQLHYFLWQLRAYFLGRKLHRRVGFQIVHHVTFVKYWVPSFLALLPVPFIWGPVGGGESAPLPFWRTFSARGWVYEAMRGLARRIGELNPFVRLTACRATLGFATTAQTETRIRALGCRRVLVYSEAGLPAEEIDRLANFRPHRGNPLRLLSIGGLLHLKGFHLGLRAFAEFHRELPASEYWLIGDGPERKRLERLAQKLGVAGNVIFWGAMPRAQVLEKLAEVDVLVHPTLHDSGGWVALEAMAAGRPVICLDLGGPGIQVTSETGIKVAAVSPDQAVTGLATAMLELAKDPARRDCMGKAAQRRVQECFAWDKKVEFMLETYTRVASGSEGQPC